MKLLKRILPLSFLLTLLFTLNAFAADSSLRFGQPWTDNTDNVLESYTAAVPDATCKAAHGFDFFLVFMLIIQQPLTRVQCISTMVLLKSNVLRCLEQLHLVRTI